MNSGFLKYNGITHLTVYVNKKGRLCPRGLVYVRELGGFGGEGMTDVPCGLMVFPPMFAGMLSCFSSVQSLSRVRLFVTPQIVARQPPCPSPTPRVHSNSGPLSRDAIQPSHPLSSPSPPAPNPSRCFSNVQFFATL